MATHRISFPHITRSSTSSAEVSGSHEHAEPNFVLFMMAPLIMALTVLATIWISRVSF